ncbi:MAG: hypothetical protein ACREK1_04075, partial [Longimicrobiales bacterium]
MDERLAELEAALRNAHNAGDTAAAKRFAAEIIRLRAVSPTMRVMLEALKTTPPEQWESRMSGAGYDSTTIADVMQAGGVPATAAAAPDSGFTLNRGPQDIPLRRDVSPEATVVAPPGTAGIPSFSEFEGRTTPREQGRQAALARDSRVGAGLQGFGSFMFGLGTPATATAVMASRALPGGKKPIGPGEAMEYARGIREGAYEAQPGAYRTGAVAGIASGVGVVRAALRYAPAAARTVFTPQSGQTLRNLLRLSAAGAAAAGTTAGLEEGAEAVPGATGVGAAAGPVLTGAGRAGLGALRMVSPDPGTVRRVAPGAVADAYGFVAGKLGIGADAAAIRALARKLGEPPAVVAAEYNRFLAAYDRAPRLNEIFTTETAQGLGEMAGTWSMGAG